MIRRLKKIELKLKSETLDKKESATLAQNLNRLQYLSITLERSDPKSVLFNEITKLKYLKVLKIHCDSTELRDIIWAQNIRILASNCVGLQYFDLDLQPDDFQNFNPMICFESISYFSGLKTLKFRIICNQPITELFHLMRCKSFSHIGAERQIN